MRTREAQRRGPRAVRKARHVILQDVDEHTLPPVNDAT